MPFISLDHVLSSNPVRGELLVLLAAMINEMVHTSLVEELASADHPAEGIATNSFILNTIKEATQHHFHLETVTLSLIDRATRKPKFNGEDFRSTEKSDNDFWQLLRNFDRPRVPPHVGLAFTIWHVEKQLGQPLPDIEVFRDLMRHDDE